MDSRDQHRGPTGGDRRPRRIQVRQTERGGHEGAARARPAGTAERRGAPEDYGGGAARRPAAAPPTATAPPAAAAPVAGPPSLLTRRYVIIGAGTLAALVCVLFIALSQPRAKCPGASKLKGPQPGSAVSGAFKLGLSVENRPCVSAVTYQIDGEDVATETTAPYEVVLNTQTLSQKLPARETHEVTATVEDTGGRTHTLEDKLTLTFAPAAAGAPGREAPEPGPAVTPAPAAPAAPAAAATAAPTRGGGSHAELSAQCERLASQISGKSGYTFAPEFTSLVEQRLGEYRGVRAFEMARRYRYEINKAFGDRDVVPIIGYALAFSRSKFDLEEDAHGVGLWQMSPKLARSSNYLTPAESDASLKDPRRSAEVAAFYLKDLLTSFETEDFMYAVACFGMGVNEAGRVSARLHEVAPDPAPRRDIIRMSKAGVLGPAHVDRVARFFAAGIIGENPQSFDRQGGQTFSSLYH